MGYLTPIDVFAPPVELDLEKIAVQAGDFVPEELAAILDNPAVTEPAVQNYAMRCPGVPTIVFCCTREHARHVAEQFQAAGFRATNVDGTMWEPEQYNRISGLADGRVQVLCVVDLISEGTDIPDVRCAIMLRPTKSRIVFKQQSGRLTRLAEGKSWALLLDMVGNVFAHGLPDDPAEERRWTLDYGLGTCFRPTPVCRCRYCFHVSEASPSILDCPMCRQPLVDPPILIREMDFLPSKKRVMQRSLAKLSDTRIKAMKYKTLMRYVDSEEDLRRVAAVRGYSAGWVTHRAAEIGR